MEKDIDRIAKNPDTDIVIRIDDYGGKKGLTIREFIKGERYTGFTKNGTRIPAEKFAQFKAAINAVNEKELAEPAQSEQKKIDTKQDSKKPVNKPEPSEESEEDVF